MQHRCLSTVIIETNPWFEFLVSSSAFSVDSVRPLYGQVTGGTRVTITGQFISVSTVKAVLIGQYVLQPDSSRLLLCTAFTKLVGMSSFFGVCFKWDLTAAVYNATDVEPSVDEFFLWTDSGAKNVFHPPSAIHPIWQLAKASEVVTV